jgi:hypothetical protein
MRHGPGFRESAAMNGLRRGFVLAAAALGLLVLAWLARSPTSPDEPTDLPRDALPPLPAWQAPGASAQEPLPQPPRAEEITDFITGSRERFRSALPDRWQLALHEGRLLGADGALALARGSGQSPTEPARLAVMLAVAEALTEAARHNDFARAEELLAALREEERAVPEIAAAARAVAAREAAWARDPQRGQRITGAIAAAEAGLAAADAAGLEAALAAAALIATEDPDHASAGEVRAQVATRARDAWRAALDAGDWQGVEAWAAWTALNLAEGQRAELAAATRAARERRAAPAPADTAR